MAILLWRTYGFTLRSLKKVSMIGTTFQSLVEESTLSIPRLHWIEAMCYIEEYTIENSMLSYFTSNLSDYAALWCLWRSLDKVLLPSYTVICLLLDHCMTHFLVFSMAVSIRRNGWLHTWSSISEFRRLNEVCRDKFGFHVVESSIPDSGVFDSCEVLTIKYVDLFLN